MGFWNTPCRSEAQCWLLCLAQFRVEKRFAQKKRNAGRETIYLRADLTNALRALVRVSRSCQDSGASAGDALAERWRGRVLPPWGLADRPRPRPRWFGRFLFTSRFQSSADARRSTCKIMRRKPPPRR